MKLLFLWHAQDAIDKGWFREQPTIDAPPSLRIILETAQQIASAMTYLHAKGIIHGDLTGGARAPAAGLRMRKLRPAHAHAPCMHAKEPSG
jgi:serine/threonine protein kinase